MTSLDAAATGLAAGRPIVSEGAGRRAVRRFLRHRAALAGLFMHRGSWPPRRSSARSSTRATRTTRTRRIQFTEPNAQYPLGTDRIGRDLFARLLYAGRVSLAVGVAAALVATGIGLILGLIAGIAGGWVDTLIMRITDVVLAIPFLILVAIVVGDRRHRASRSSSSSSGCRCGRRLPGSCGRSSCRCASRTSSSPRGRWARRTAGSSASTCCSTPSRR